MQGQNKFFPTFYFIFFRGINNVTLFWQEHTLYVFERYLFLFFVFKRILKILFGRRKVSSSLEKFKSLCVKFILSFFPIHLKEVNNSGV